MLTPTRFFTLALAAAAPGMADDPGAAPVRFGHVQLDDGVRIRYAESGNPSGEPIVFLHGYSDSWYSFSPILPLLGDRYRLIAPDQRGHGASSQPAGGYHMRDLARDVVALMDSLGIPRATIVGHSMGSFVAKQVGLAAPERVSRLVLIGSAHVFDQINDRAAFEEAVFGLGDPVSLDFIRAFQVSTIHHPVPPAFLDSVVVESTRLTARVWKELLRGMLATGPATGLASAPFPVLLVWGDRDAVFSPAQRDALAAMLPKAKRIDYADTGHATHWERPAEFVRDLEKFIRDTRATGAAR